MKIVIAGYGSIGRRHLRNLLALGERDIVLYRSNHSTLPQDEIAGFPVEIDLLAALAHHPDAVIISNPTALHLDVAIPAAERGCAILLEKPVSHSLERVDEFRAALKRGGGVVLTGFQFRFHPTLRLAVKMIAEGVIGPVQSARAHWGEYLPNWHPWEDFRQGYAARPDLGGGVTLTLSHPFDYLRWMLGEIQAVWAFTNSSGGLGLDVEDTVEVGLRFRSGAAASLHLDYLQQPPTHTLEVVGSLGTLRWNNADGALAVYTPASGWQTDFPPDGFERNSLFLDEMKHFLAVARRETPPQCGLEDGVRALQAALAALQSGQDGLLKQLE